MPNPNNKLSSILKALHTGAPDILSNADELVSDEAQKWPLFKALAPRKPAVAKALTPVDKRNWLSTEPTPPPQQAATPAAQFNGRLAAGLRKMANPNKPAARKQVKPKKVEPQPKATRAKLPAKKTTSAKIVQMPPPPLDGMLPEQAVLATKITMTPKAIREVSAAPAPVSPVNNPSAQWSAAKPKPKPAASKQAAPKPKAEKELGPPASATPSVNSLLSLFNLEAPTVAPDPQAPPAPQEYSTPANSPATGTPADAPEPPTTEAGAELQNLSAESPEVNLALPSNASVEPGAIHMRPARVEPALVKPALIEHLPIEPEPIPAAQPKGSLKSLLNKLQAPTDPPAAPAIKTLGFLNRLNKK